MATHIPLASGGWSVCDHATGGAQAVRVSGASTVAAVIQPYYQDTHVVLYHGDCLAVLPEIGQVDHVITDPPYDEHTHAKQRRGAAGGVGHQFGFGRNAKGISMERHLGFSALTTDQVSILAGMFAQLSSRWCMVFCSMEQQAIWQSAIVSRGLQHVRFGVWHKTGSTPQFTGDRPGTACEAIEIAHRPGAKRWNGGGGFGFWEFPIVKTHTGARFHTTQKPLDLMEALVRDFTDYGEIICDPFAGSGTTGVAAKKLGRKAILIEQQEKYCEVAAKRLQNTQEQYRIPFTTERLTQPELSSEGGA